MQGDPVAFVDAVRALPGMNRAEVIAATPGQLLEDAELVSTGRITDVVAAENALTIGAVEGQAVVRGIEVRVEVLDPRRPDGASANVDAPETTSVFIPIDDVNPWNETDIEAAEDELLDLAPIGAPVLLYLRALPDQAELLAGPGGLFIEGPDDQVLAMSSALDASLPGTDFGDLTQEVTALDASAS